MTIDPREDGCFGGEEVQDRCKCLWEESFWQQQEITSGIWFIAFYKKKKKTVNAHEKWAYIVYRNKAKTFVSLTTTVCGL